MMVDKQMLVSLQLSIYLCFVSVAVVLVALVRRIYFQLFLNL